MATNIPILVRLVSMIKERSPDTTNRWNSVLGELLAHDMDDFTVRQIKEALNCAY